MSHTPTLLVVDGDAHSLLAICSLLSRMGIRYKRNTNGVRVVHQVRQMSPRPDGILMSASLPEGNPLQIIQNLQADLKLRHVPIIITPDPATSQVTQDTLVRSGCFALLPKPISPSRFEILLGQIQQTVID